MTALLELLSRHPLTTGLSDQIVKQIAECATEVEFEADSYVFRTDTPADAFYLIRDGTVALEVYVPGPGPFRFLTLKQGELLGASWLVEPYRWTYDARAVKLTRAIAFDSGCMRELCEADHHLGYEMMKRFVPPLLERLQLARLQSVDLYSTSLDRSNV